VHVVGILNLTSDSFSDGGRFLDPVAAIVHARDMRAGGADWIDVGAESSNPAGAAVEPAEQIRRIEPVVRALVSEGVHVSIDTHRPEVLSAALSWGVGMVNDVTALADPRCVEILRESRVPIVLMFAAQEGVRARTEPRAPDVDDAIAFLAGRIDALGRAGIDADRIVVDPGMGFFLSPDPEPSLRMLRGMGRIKAALGRPVYVSTSRKSFVGTLLGGRPPADRAAGTLATEIWALAHGADWVRTHDPRALRDAWNLWTSLSTGS